MLRKNYDPEKKECKLCGCLLPDNPIDIGNHECSPYAKLNKVLEPFQKEAVMERAIEVKFKDIAPTLIGTLEETEGRYKQLQEFVKKQMVDKEDYGTIPGCPKPSLFKAGAEKLLEIYGYSVSDIQVTNKVEDWEKGLFHYEVKAVATSKRSGEIVGTGIGSCNSKEKKFIKQDPYSLVNTFMKMAKKRAVVDLALLVTRSSGIFTQDVEDMDINGNGHTEPAPVIKHETIETKTENGTQVEYKEIPEGGCTEKQQKAVYAILKSVVGEEGEVGAWLLDNYGVEHSRSLSKAQVSEIIDKYGRKSA